MRHSKVICMTLSCGARWTGDQITERIGKIDVKRCRAELRPVLPEDVYVELERVEFESLRAAVKSIFEERL